MSKDIDIDEFIQDLAKIAAKQIRKTSGEAERAMAWMRLQDATSLYSPMCYDLINEELNK